MARLETRLAALESEGADHGCMLFCGVNGNEFFEISSDFGCLDALQAAEQGNPDKRRVWSQDDLGALCDEGFTVMVVKYADDWLDAAQEAQNGKF